MFLVRFLVSLLSAAASLRPAQCSASQMSFNTPGAYFGFLPIFIEPWALGRAIGEQDPVER